MANINEDNKDISKKDTQSTDQGTDPQRLLGQREGGHLRDLFSRFLEEDFFQNPFDFSRSPGLASMLNRQLVPRVDVSETETHVKVIADVPGVDPDNLEINVEENRMILSGTTMRESSQNERPYRYERTYGEFRREFLLPATVKKDEVRAVHKNGVLTITVPKTESKKSNKIQIERQ